MELFSLPSARDAIPKIYFDTAAFPADQRFSIWASAMPTHDVSLPENLTPGDFNATAEVWMLGDLIVSNVSFGPAHFSRTQEKIFADGTDPFIVYLIRSGSLHGLADGTELTAGAGQLFVFDQSRPASTTHTSIIECVTLSVARKALLDVMRELPDVHGLVFDSPMGRLLADHMMAMTRALDTLPAKDVPTLVKATLQLVAATMLAQFAAADVSARSGQPYANGRAIRNYIETHIASPELTPEGICRALNISRATLYRSFPRPGGVAAYIRKRRLESIHVRLSDPDDRRNISSLAYQFGFSSPTHFNHAFRDQYGYSPRDARRRRVSLLEAAQGDEEKTALYRRWVKALA